MSSQTFLQKHPPLPKNKGRNTYKDTTMNQIINMIIQQVTRRLISSGINLGMSKASKLGKKPADEVKRESK